MEIKGTGDFSKANRWNLLREDVSLPAAVIYQDKLEGNIAWMQEFAERNSVMLAPHGKTTMTPALFRRQIDRGAWGISVATASQAKVASDNGIENILMANQLVGLRNMEIINSLDRKTEFHCLVDSAVNALQLGNYFADRRNRINVLIEIGIMGGRCGCRNTAQVREVVDVLRKFDCLKLAGLEIYEGILKDGAAICESVRKEIRKFLNYALMLYEEDAYNTDRVLLTGAGSVWYDIVASELSSLSSMPVIPVIRPGCYITGDNGIYKQAQQKIIERNHIAGSIDGGIKPCLEIWAYIISVPESGLAIVGMGKRDVAFDSGLPQPSMYFRPGISACLAQAPSGWKTTGIMDQHTFMEISPNDDIKAGDIVTFSISHPCLTFDKWKNICLTDNCFNVIEVLETFF